MLTSRAVPRRAALAVSACLTLLLTAPGVPLQTVRAAATAETQSLLLSPQDTFLNLDDTNYSTNTILGAYTWPDNQVANAILMKFDLSALPAGAVVQEATLHLALVDSDGTAEGSYTVTAHKVLGASPVVAKATGNTFDGATGWTANACCFGGTPLAQADVSPAYDTRAIDKTPGYKVWTLTRMVQEWLADPATNFGLLLNSDASRLADRYRFFASMEHPDAASRPFLRVAYKLPTGRQAFSPRDTFLNVNSKNYSSSALLATYTWPDRKVANAILMKFDPSSLPAGAVVEEAMLYLALTHGDAQPQLTYTVTAHKVIGKNPAIGKATGYTFDGATGWTPNAGCYNDVPLAQADVSSAYDARMIDKMPGFKVWDLTRMVEEWLADPATNFGLLLNSDASKPRDRYRGFASMEHPNSAIRPVLSVAYTLPSSDTTPPSVSITSPSGGATVSGTITVAAGASDDVGVAGVQFKLDGANLGAEDTTSPYSVSWDTTGVANGSHTLTAVARDAAGNATASAPVTVTVANDTTPPSVSISSPSGGATVSGTITVAASASDNVGVVGVQFKRDGVNLGAEDTTSPYSVSWDTTGVANGSHTLAAVARDAAGNITTSASVSVTVSNDKTAPSVSIGSPSGGATVSGTITVEASASDNVGVVGVQFRLDGVNLGAEDTTSPYSVSWDTTKATDGGHTLTAVARDAAGNKTTSAGVSVTVSNTTSSGGIAALYPGDVGIESHPDVVLVERFEDALSTIFGRWTDILNGSAMSLASDVPAGSPGSRSLTIPYVGGTNTGGHLYKQLSAGVDDTLYVRYYVKYPTDTYYNHTGIWMGGYNPSLSWPNPQAGVKPSGSDRFSASAEQNTLTSRFDHYNYWMGMHPSGDGKYWGNLLLNNPNVQAKAGQWMCVEHMIRLNNPVSYTNGEHAVWLDGAKVSHLGQGFPKGYWSGGVFTQDPGGSPFEGFQWRNDSNLKLNWIWLQVYATSAPSGYASNVKFDHVVLAKSRVGCLASGSSDTTAPTVSISAPLAGVTVSGTSVTVSADASDNVGVAGVQFKLDGVNLGAEDTTAPYSISWDTTKALNGSHTLTAVARDAAGNATTSAGVTVSVSNLVASAWPNQPSGFVSLNEQPWDSLTANGWNYLRRTASKDSDVVADASVPYSPLNDLRIIFTTDMQRDTEPGVHWKSLPKVKEVYTAWWIKLSSNWKHSSAGAGKISFLFTDGDKGQVYTNLYHPYSWPESGDDPEVKGPPYKVGANTEWSPYGQKIWYPNVETTWIYPGEWHRIEFYYRWETTPGSSRDGIVRWWVDGVLNGNHTNVQYPASSFTEFQFAPTVQDPPSVEQYMYIDHTYMSAP